MRASLVAACAVVLSLCLGASVLRVQGLGEFDSARGVGVGVPHSGQRGRCAIG